MGGALEFIRGRGWRASAFAVGVLALFVAGWATTALDSDGGWSSLALAIGFIGVTTLLLIPRTKPQRRHDPDAERRGSEPTSA